MVNHARWLVTSIIGLSGYHGQMAHAQCSKTSDRLELIRSPGLTFNLHEGIEPNYPRVIARRKFIRSTALQKGARLPDRPSQFNPLTFSLFRLRDE